MYSCRPVIFQYFVSPFTDKYLHIYKGLRACFVHLLRALNETKIPASFGYNLTLRLCTIKNFPLSKTFFFVLQNIKMFT